MHRSSLVLISITTVLTFTGCATIRTMPTLGSYGSPKVYSGARLDTGVLIGSADSLGKFTVLPPEHPLLDLPFSAILDTIILPITFSVAAYEIIFE